MKDTESIGFEGAYSKLSELAEIAGEGSVLLLVAARLVDKEAGVPVNLKPIPPAA